MSADGRRAAPCSPPAGVGRLLAAVRGRRPRRLALRASRRLRAARRPGRDLIAVTEASGLRGRGGGGFPTGDEASGRGGRPRAARSSSSTRPRASRRAARTRRCSAHTPHLVLDGAAAAASRSAPGGRSWPSAGQRRAERAVVAEALTERRDPLRLAARRRPGRASSRARRLRCVAALDGRGRPSPPSSRRTRSSAASTGAPTLVQNAETLAHVALIARFGAAGFARSGPRTSRERHWSRSRGASHAPASTRSSSERRSRTLLEQAGGPTEPREGLSRRRLLRRLDAPTQHHPADPPRTASAPASIVALPAGACGVRESARVARYLADESAGQCGPCVHGLDALAPASSEVAAGQAATIANGWSAGRRRCTARGACRHPDGAARFVAEHARGLRGRGRPAPAARPVQRQRPPQSSPTGSACSEPRLRVDPIACDGHGLCAELFPERIDARRLGLSDHRRQTRAGRARAARAPRRSRSARSSLCIWSSSGCAPGRPLVALRTPSSPLPPKPAATPPR